MKRALHWALSTNGRSNVRLWCNLRLNLQQLVPTFELWLLRPSALGKHLFMQTSYRWSAATASEVFLRQLPLTSVVVLRHRSFLQALLPQLMHLQPLVGGGRPGKELFLRLLGRLLALNARLVLSPSQPAFGFLLDSYIALLGTRCVRILIDLYNTSFF